MSRRVTDKRSKGDSHSLAQVSRANQGRRRTECQCPGMVIGWRPWNSRSKGLYPGLTVRVEGLRRAYGRELAPILRCCATLSQTCSAYGRASHHTSIAIFSRPMEPIPSRTTNLVSNRCVVRSERCARSRSRERRYPPQAFALRVRLAARNPDVELRGSSRCGRRPRPEAARDRVFETSTPHRSAD